MSDKSSVTRTNETAPDRDASADQRALTPTVDIFETAAGITLLADMPGVSKERLSVEVDGESLTIEGRVQIDVPDGVQLLHSEVRSPFFRRSFTLSRDLDPAKIEATLRHGVLQMHIPKSEAARPKRIEVQLA